MGVVCKTISNDAAAAAAAVTAIATIAAIQCNRNWMTKITDERATKKINEKERKITIRMANPLENVADKIGTLRK